MVLYLSEVSIKHLILFLAPALIACSHSTEFTADNQPKPVGYSCSTNCVIAFGDSITVGVGTTSPTTKGYAYLVATALNKEIKNIGLGGSKLESLNQYGEMMAFHYVPGQIVIFLTGYNDMRTYGLDQGRLNTYRERLEAIFALWEASGVEAYVGTSLTMLPEAYSTGENINHGSDAAAAAYSQVVKDLIQQRAYRHVHLVDTTTNWRPSYTNMNEDLSHPNDIGAAEIADLFLDEIL